MKGRSSDMMITIKRYLAAFVRTHYKHYAGVRVRNDIIYVSDGNGDETIGDEIIEVVLRGETLVVNWNEGIDGDEDWFELEPIILGSPNALEQLGAAVVKLLNQFDSEEHQESVEEQRNEQAFRHALERDD